MTHRPKSTERLNDDDVLEQIGILTHNQSGMIQTNFGKLQSEMTSFFDTTVSRLADALLHPDEEPNWDALNRAALTIEAYFIVCDLFLQNEHLSDKALHYLTLVRTGIEQLWKLRSNGAIAPVAPRDTHVPEGPHLKQREVESLDDIKREGRQANNDFVAHRISEEEYYRRRRDHFERARALLPAPEVTEYLYALQSEFEDRVDPPNQEAPGELDQIILDSLEISHLLGNKRISIWESKRRLRELIARARALPQSKDVTDQLKWMERDLSELEEALTREDISAILGQPNARDSTDAIEEAVPDTLAQIRIDDLRAGNAFGHKQITAEEYYQTLAELRERIRALPASEARGQLLNLITRQLDDLVPLLEPSDEPEPEAEEPGPADGGDIIEQELKLLELDVLGADKELVSGLIYFPVWRERMMQLFERGKRNLPHDDPRRHDFLVDKMLVRVGSLTSEGARSIARENLLAAGALDTPRTEPDRYSWDGGGSGIIIKAYH